MFKKLAKEKSAYQYSNYLLLGPHCSGKSYIQTKVVNPKKIMKKVFENTDQLDEILNPVKEKCNMFNHVTPGQNIDEVLDRLKDTPKITCIICFCDFGTQLARLSERIRQRTGTKMSFSGYDEPLQYDYIELINKLAYNNTKFYVIDTGYGHDTLCEQFLGGLPWNKKRQGFISVSFFDKIGEPIDTLIHILKRRGFGRIRSLLGSYIIRKVSRVILRRQP